MIHVSLTPEQREAVQALRGDARLTPPERDRVEMVLLSEMGWSVPAIANHLNYCAASIRRIFKQFSKQGLSALRHRRLGPSPNMTRRRQVETALSELLSQERTFTASQLAYALKEEGIHLSARQLRRYLQRIAGWRRTVRTLKHNQDPQKVARAKKTLATLKKSLPRQADTGVCG